MAYHNFWIAEIILQLVAVGILAAIVTAIFDYAFKPDHDSLNVLVFVISFALLGAFPLIDAANSSEVILVSEKTHDVDKIIAENNLKVHVSTFTPMRPVQENLEFADTEITTIEPDVKYVMYWTTGLGKKKMRAFEYIKKESINEKQTENNQAEIDKYKLENSSISGNNP